MSNSKAGSRKIIWIVLAVIAVCAIGIAAAVLLTRKQVTATTIQLVKSEGSVSVLDDNGGKLAMKENMKLYDGYHVATEEKSYAWMELDETKLAKLDTASELELRKNNKDLELLLVSGNVFFNVTKPLEDDETMSIHTSTMVAGIRGTCGWVQELGRGISSIYVLEGSVECSVSDPVSGQNKSVTVNSGEQADLYVYGSEKEGDKCEIVCRQFTTEDILGFILQELQEDKELCEKIYDASGIDLRGITMEDVLARMEMERTGKATPTPEPTPTPTLLPTPNATPTLSPTPSAAPTPEPAPAGSFEYGSDGAGGIVITKYVGLSAEVDIPEEIDGKPVTAIGDEAFYGCSLTALAIPESVKTIGSYAFGYCANLTDIMFGNGVTILDYGAFEGCEGLMSVTLPDSVTEIGGRVFSNCKNLTQVRFGNNMKMIGSYAFAGCSALTDIRIPESVTELGYAVFEGCSSLSND